MNPLMEKYFFGELTDSEEEKLESLLTESEDAAWEFGQAAEEIYNRYGLPEPGSPEGGPDGPAKRTQHWTWILSIFALLLIVGALRMIFRPTRLSPHPVWTPTKALKPIHARKVSAKKISPRHAAALPKARMTLAVPPEGRASKVSGTNLRVVVHRQTTGPVTVRVVNSQGLEVRRLYGGSLPAGRWAFEWDGRGGDGRLVAPGKYRIVVETGGSAQSKEVDIH